MAVYIHELGLFQSTPPVKAATQNATTASHGMKFQSTPPVKAATVIVALLRLKNWISIHAAREGGDPRMSRGCAGTNYFNPRRP